MNGATKSIQRAEQLILGLEEAQQKGEQCTIVLKLDFKVLNDHITQTTCGLML